MVIRVSNRVYVFFLDRKYLNWFYLFGWKWIHIICGSWKILAFKRDGYGIMGYAGWYSLLELIRDQASLRLGYGLEP